MPDSPQRRVLQTTWNWQAAQGLTVVPGENLRRAALVQAVVMALVGVLLYFGFHHHLFARIVWILAAVILGLGMFLPPAYRPVHAFGRWLGRVVGTGLTYVLLVPFFFLFFTPVALLLRIQGRDPLHRRYRDPRWTYWIGRTPKERGENIDRQFLREDKQAREALRPVGTVAAREGTGRS